MFRKFNTKTLIIVLVILAAGVFILNYFEGKQGNRTFKKELVTIDTAKVSAIYIYPKGQGHTEIKLTGSDGKWTVESDGKKAGASSANVKNMLAELLRVKSKRLVAKDEEKWEEYEVKEDVGTRVKVMEGGEATLDMVIGKFSFNQQARSASSYVRLTDDKFVYVVEGFLDMTFNRDFDAFRDKKLVTSNFNGWTSLTFNYPDSAFSLQKSSQGQWTLNGGPVDSTELESYCKTLANLSGSEFVDDFDVNAAPPAFSLDVKTFDNKDFTLHAYAADSVHQYILSSTQNPEGKFSGAKGNLYKRVFVGASEFMPKAENP